MNAPSTLGQRAAKAVLPHAVFGYVNGGTEDCLTLQANREAFRSVQFRPRGLVGVAQSVAFDETRPCIDGPRHASLCGSSTARHGACARRRASMPAPNSRSDSTDPPGPIASIVTGPRIDPRSLPRRREAQVRGYLPNLTEHLAACDVALVQCGLTTCMELTANQRPFVYVPLRHHFEQNFHVHHRLQRYGAGRRCDYDEATNPDGLAKVVADEIGREVDYLPVESGGAARAAASIAELVS